MKYPNPSIKRQAARVKKEAERDAAALALHTEREGSRLRQYAQQVESERRDPPMFMAKMDSEHYEWIAFGRSPIAAKVALRDAFVANHPNRDNMTVTEHNELLSDVYGITVIEAVAGRCYRDGEEVRT